MRQLQSVQNAAARYHHVTTVLQRLHWLPIRRRVVFKMATLVFCQGRRWLPSATSRTCVVNLSVGPTATMETVVLQLQVRTPKL